MVGDPSREDAAADALSVLRVDDHGVARDAARVTDKEGTVGAAAGVAGHAAPPPAAAAIEIYRTIYRQPL